MRQMLVSRTIARVETMRDLDRGHAALRGCPVMVRKVQDHRRTGTMAPCGRPISVFRGRGQVCSFHVAMAEHRALLHTQALRRRMATYWLLMRVVGASRPVKPSEAGIWLIEDEQEVWGPRTGVGLNEAQAADDLDAPMYLVPAEETIEVAA